VITETRLFGKAHRFLPIMDDLPVSCSPPASALTEHAVHSGAARLRSEKATPGIPARMGPENLLGRRERSRCHYPQTQPSTSSMVWADACSRPVIAEPIFFPCHLEQACRRVARFIAGSTCLFP